jgi:hypothetical protein
MMFHRFLPASNGRGHLYGVGCHGEDGQVSIAVFLALADSLDGRQTAISGICTSMKAKSNF